jgi:hypothetical protein
MVAFWVILYNYYAIFINLLHVFEMLRDELLKPGYGSFVFGFFNIHLTTSHLLANLLDVV